MTIEERLESLEQKLSAMTMPSGKIIQAEQFVLVNSNGEGRAILMVHDDKPFLSLFYDNEKVRAQLDINGLHLLDDNGVVRASHDLKGLTLLDENGNLRASLDLNTLFLFDKNGKNRATLSVTVLDGKPFLSLNDENENLRACLQVSDRGPFLSLNDENDRLIWSAP
jgi:hypothetical protein